MATTLKSVAARNRAAAQAAAATQASVTKGVDLGRVDPLLGALYDGAMQSPPWHSALELLKDELKAKHVTLMLRPPSPDSSGVMINTGPVTTQGQQSYETHFFALD